MRAHAGPGRRAAPLVLFVGALLARAGYVLLARPAFDGYYWELSGSLLASGSLTLDGVRTARFEPLYPLFLAAARFLARDNVLAVQLLQCAVASAAAVFLYWLARALAGDRTAAIASVIFAVHPLLVRHASDLSDSALTTTTLVAFAWAFVRAQGSWSAAAAGACLGLSVLTRAVSAPLVIAAPVVLFVRGRRGEAAAFALAAAAAVGPMVARDYATAGALAPPRQGVNLFIGNSDYTAALLPEHSPDILQSYADATAATALGMQPDTPGFETLADPVLARLAWSRMAAHPIDTARLKMRNVWYFFSPFLVPSRLLLPSTTIALGENGRVEVGNAPLRPASERIVFGAVSVILLPLAIAGAALRRREVSRDAVLWLVLLTFASVYALYFPATRYSAAVTFVPIFYAASALARALP